MYLLVIQVLWSRALPLSGRSGAQNGPNYEFGRRALAVNTESLMV